MSPGDSEPAPEDPAAAHGGGSGDDRVAARPRDLNDAVAAAARLLRRRLGKEVRLATILDPAVGPVRVEPGDLEEILLTLAALARVSMPRGGDLCFVTSSEELVAEDRRARLGRAGLGAHVRITVADTGDGLEVDALPPWRGFEPPRREAAAGLDGGLARVVGLVVGAGGSIGVDSRRGGGSCLSIFLPRCAEEDSRDRGGRPAPAGTVPTRILLAEGDESVRRLERWILAGAGHGVVEAATGGEALSRLTEPGPAFDLLLAEVALPELGGDRLAAELRCHSPRTRACSPRERPPRPSPAARWGCPTRGSCGSPSTAARCCAR